MLLNLGTLFDGVGFETGAGAGAAADLLTIFSAATLNTYLNQLGQEPELVLQLIFFDGEEQLYTNTMFGPDGIYGSKHLGIFIFYFFYFFLSLFWDIFCQTSAHFCTTVPHLQTTHKT